MELALASLIVDVSLGVAEWVKVGLGARKNKKMEELVASLQKVDGAELASSIDRLQLAGVMRGKIDASLVSSLIASPTFQTLVRELFLAIIADAGAHKNDQIQSLITSYFRRELVGIAEDSDICHFSDGICAILSKMAHRQVDLLNESHPNVLTGLQNAAASKRITSTLEAVESHLASFHEPDSERRQRKKEWIEKYRRQCIRVHGHIIPPDFDRSRKIPIADLYVSPRFRSLAADSQENLSVTDMIGRVDRTVVLGDPGGGKSTFAAYAVSKWATICAEGNGLVPFHITLREFAQHHDERSVLDHIHNQLNTLYQVPDTDGFTDELLTDGSAVVVFDGLDELIDTSKRRVITQIVELFGSAYPNVRIAVTSRRVGYEQSRLDPAIFSEYVVGAFSLQDVKQYVHKWFATQDDYLGRDTTALADSFIEQSGAVTDLRSNPLMLSLMCIIFRGENFIPRNRPGVYEKCATLLFEKWDGHRMIEVPLRAAQHVDPAMKYFAFWMLTNDSAEVGVTYDSLVSEMASYLMERAFTDRDEAKKAAAEFVDFCKGRAWVFTDVGTTADGESLWAFTHRTFMEYFAAYHLTRVYSDPDRLARQLLPKIASGQWDVVAQLAVQIADKSFDRGSERVLSVLLKDPRKRTYQNRENVLSFISRCLKFAVVSERFVETATSAILSSMFAKRNWGETFRFVQRGVAWMHLIENSSPYRGSVTKAHHSFLDVAFSSGDAERLEKASLVTLWLATAPSGFPYFRHSDQAAGWEEWRAPFISIAKTYRPQIRSASTHQPALAVLMAWIGLESIEAAVERLERTGWLAGTVLFNALSDARSAFRGYSFCDIFISECLLEPAEVLDQDHPLRQFARFLTNVIVTASTSGGLATERRRGMYPFVAPQPMIALPQSRLSDPEIARAFILVQLAVAEQLPMTRHHVWRGEEDDLLFNLIDHRDRRSIPTDFQAIGAIIRDATVEDLVRDWSQGAISILKPAPQTHKEER